MKRCPACKRVYTDETLRFCLDDGVALIREQASAPDPYATLQVTAPRSTDPTDKLPASGGAPGSPVSWLSQRRNLLMIAAAVAAVAAITLIATYFYFSEEKQVVATINQAPSPTPTPEGRWFIIFGTYPKAELSKANERVSFVKYKGYDARLVDTDEYPNLKDGTWAVVMGPYRKDYAQEIANEVRSIFPDSYVKSGW